MANKIKWRGAVLLCIGMSSNLLDRQIDDILQTVLENATGDVFVVNPSADAIEERLFDAVEVTPAGVLAADEATLRDAGLSRQKVSYVRNIAEAFDEHGYSRASFEGMDDDAVVAELTSISGVGPWTAKMQLLFSLGRPDVFPVEDLGIRNAVAAVCDETLDRAEMVDRAEQWRPYRSYASLYLWRAVD